MQASGKDSNRVKSKYICILYTYIYIIYIINMVYCIPLLASNPPGRIGQSSSTSIFWAFVPVVPGNIHHNISQRLKRPGQNIDFIDLFHFILEWPTPTDFPI